MSDSEDEAVPQWLFSKLAAAFRAGERPLIEATLKDLNHLLYKALIVRLRRWPWDGEILTELARFSAQLKTVEIFVRIAANGIFARKPAYLRVFWTEVRRARVPRDLQEDLAILLANDEVTYGNILLRPDDVLPDKEFARKLFGHDQSEATVALCREVEEAEAEWQMRYEQGLAARILPLMERLDIPAPVYEDLSRNLAVRHHALSAVLGTMERWQTVIELMRVSPSHDGQWFRLLPEEEGRIVHKDDTARFNVLWKLFFAEARIAKETRAHLATVMEKTVKQTRRAYANWRAGLPMEGALAVGDTALRLFVGAKGLIAGLCKEDALPILDFLEELGIRLEEDAAHIVLGCPIGPDTSDDATWYVYPAMDVTVLIAAHPQANHDAAFVVRGDAAQAHAWLLECYGRPSRSHGSNDALAGTPRAYADAVHARGVIEQVRAQTATVQDFLADHDKKRRQGS